MKAGICHWFTLGALGLVAAACGSGSRGGPDPAPDSGIEVVMPPRDAAGGTDEGADSPDDDSPDLSDPAPDPRSDAPADPGVDPSPPDPGPVDPGGEVPAACTMEGDHVLGVDQVPVLLGGALSYRVRVTPDPAPIADLQGSPCSDGLCWDLSGPVAGDHAEVDVVRPVSDFWFAGHYPADAFVVPVQEGVLGVYRRTATQLQMLGMGSPTAEGDVDVAYTPPVVILQLPLKKGDAYETVAEARGRYQGYDYPYLGTVRIFHTYRFLANGQGRLAVPGGDFQVVRLLLDLTMEVVNPFLPNYIAPQHFKVYDFLAECVGLVARVRSGEGEAATFFSTATEYRRLGLE